jgi:hypothetical protein
MRPKPLNNQEDGLIIVAVIATIIFIGMIMFGLFSLANANLIRSKSRVLQLEAQYAAESGADAAIATLNSGNDTYTGTGSASPVSVLTAATYKATYTTTVANGSTAKERVITAVGNVYAPKSSTTPKFKRTIKVVAQRSSQSTASSMVSRNILALDSSVKDVSAKDIFLNGYITLAKNTNNLIAENITVAGKNTGATNCSIGGSGSLSKPTSFSNAGQTKTKLTLAYNNCISPPGNTSNANFDVSANQTNISSLQSTYVPWSQYMDSSYQSAPQGCNDWTTGTSPRTIPSTGNTKKTHYPDSSSGISTSCGTSGDLNLGTGQYNIQDNVHIRANLCASSACKPTFYNPSSTTRYIFVEGSVNFDQLLTASGSGPIVLIVYGSDPSSKAGTCPYGGSVFLGNGGSTNAPAMYLLATNGICLYQTKFAAKPALGGIGGKNIYIATNSGTPFDLGVSTSFPVSDIPLDLSWRAVYYQRL